MQCGFVSIYNVDDPISGKTDFDGVQRLPWNDWGDEVQCMVIFYFGCRFIHFRNYMAVIIKVLFLVRTLFFLACNSLKAEVFGAFFLFPFVERDEAASFITGADFGGRPLGILHQPRMSPLTFRSFCSLRVLGRPDIILAACAVVVQQQ